MGDEEPVPLLGKRDVARLQALSAVDDQEHEIDVDRRRRPRPGKRIDPCAIPCRSWEDILEPRSTSAALSRSARDGSSPRPSSRALIRLGSPSIAWLMASIKPRLPRALGPDDRGNQNILREIPIGRSGQGAAGQPAIVVGADGQPAAHQFDQVNAQTIHERLVEPAKHVLLHVPPGRLDDQLSRPQPDQAAERIEDRRDHRVEIVGLGDVAGHLHGSSPVRERDQVSPGNLA